MAAAHASTRRHSTVVAVDLRGVGGSDVPDTGYDAATMAADLVALADRLDLDVVDVVGHDIGGQVAYAFARGWSERCRTATIIETLLPGIEPFLTAKVDVPMWHGEFHMIPGLAEQLVVDRQRTYFDYFFGIGTRADGVIDDEALQHYAEAYGTFDRLRAAFEMYRATPANIEWNAARRDPIDVALLLVGGEHVFGPSLVDAAANLRANFGWTDVTAEILPDGQHYVVEERSDDIRMLIERHLGR